MSLLSCFRLDLNANFVIGNEVLTLDDLTELSRPFLRFDEVELDYNSGSHLIANKCEIFASQLQKVPRLSEANSICAGPLSIKTYVCVAIAVTSWITLNF